MTQAEIDEAMTTPTTLTFWTWVPSLQAQVDLFEKKYPAIKVELVNQGTSTVQYPKLRTALKAGDGAPDVAHIAYEYMPSFELTDSLLDLTPYGAADMKDEFVPSAWKYVSNDHGVFGYPQDTGPMGNLYRADLYQKAGVTEAPTTWDEYAKAAEKVKTATGSYISDMPGNDPGQLLGLFQQAGARPFGFDGDKTVSVNIDSEEARKVLAYWQDLIDRDLISTDADFNDGWYQGLANGKYAGWVTAAWGPVFLQGTAANTSGLWKAAPLPQWNAGETVSGNWGGSATAVLATTKHAIAANEFAKFINTDPESTLNLANEQFLFPATVATLKSTDFTDLQSDFYGGQEVNKLFAQISGTVDPDFPFLPFNDYVYSAYNETLGKAISEKGDLATGLTDWQTKVVDYAKQQGFTVQ